METFFKVFGVFAFGYFSVKLGRKLAERDRKDYEEAKKKEEAEKASS